MKRKKSIIVKHERMKMELVPDMTLQAIDHLRERLDIYIEDSEIRFCASIDGCGQTWIVDRGMLQKLIE